MKAYKKRKVWLTEEQVNGMIELAKAKSQRDHLLLLLMRYGLRCGEITGWRTLPGIRFDDIRSNGIWIKGKGFRRGVGFSLDPYDPNQRLVPMPPHVLEMLKGFVASFPKAKPDEKVFPISEVWAEQLVKNYAKQAGVEDWQHIGPHRLRAFFATDAKDQGIDGFTIRDLMRHRNIQTTNIYIGESTPERLGLVVNRLAYRRKTLEE